MSSLCKPELKIVLVGLALMLISNQLTHGQEVPKVRAVIIPTGVGLCPSAQDKENAVNELSEEISQILSDLVGAETTQSSSHTTNIPETTTTDPQYAYTCNGTPGWKRVVFIDMTDTSYNCPPGLNLTSYSKRTCGRQYLDDIRCSSTTFSVGGSEYSQVCGRIRGYQVGDTAAFLGSKIDFPATLDNQYVDGVSLTHGPPGNREHIWTFAAGLNEGYNSSYPEEQCFCDNSAYGSPPPAFTGNDYFCESGLQERFEDYHFSEPFLDDPLWDGQDCSSTSTCCERNNPPWFTKNLPNPTTDDIELRLCFRFPYIGDVPLEVIELYVQ